MNVLLALSLIFIFYYLFMLNDRNHRNVSNNNKLTENFQNSNNQDENEKLLLDIDSYFSKRISDQNASLEDLKNKVSCVYIPKDEFTEPIVINSNVETNETKVMSDSPVYVPVNLHIDGSLVINNLDVENEKNELSKNLCMGDNCYSEQDILYIIQDLLPYYKMVPRGGDEIEKLCFESYDTLKNLYELPPLEATTIREGLDYNGKLIALREIVKEYSFDLSDNNVDKNLIIANSLRTDYNVINFISKNPELLSLVSPKHISPGYPVNNDNIQKFIEDFKKETEEKYSEIQKVVEENNAEITKKNCIGGDDLRILRGERDIKLETEDPDIINRTKLTGWENAHTNAVDGIRRSYRGRGMLKRDYAGEESVQLYDNTDIYYDKTIKGDNLTELPYLNEQHFEVHGLNDDDNDCLNYKKLKTATMSKSKKGDERQRNGSFNIEMEPGKEGETGVFCKPV